MLESLCMFFSGPKEQAWDTHSCGGQLELGETKFVITDKNTTDNTDNKYSHIAVWLHFRSSIHALAHT